jgi:surface protein
MNSNLDYKFKYLKYKNKYLNLKNQRGGIVFNNETLRQAVQEYMADENTAIARYGNISNWDTSQVTNTKGIFELSKDWLYNYVTSFDNDSLKNAVQEYLADENRAIAKYGDISTWNTSRVTDMSYMFTNSRIFNGDISNWDTSQVTDMSHMFAGATHFNKSINTRLHSWDTSKVTNMSYMFALAGNFNQDIHHLQV